MRLLLMIVVERAGEKPVFVFRLLSFMGTDVAG